MSSYIDYKREGYVLTRHTVTYVGGTGDQLRYLSGRGGRETGIGSIRPGSMSRIIFNSSSIPILTLSRT